MFLSSTVIWQVYKEDLYENLDVSSGLLFPPPESFPKDTEAYLKASVAVIIFFYSSLWFVKFSFLVFFRRLGDRVRGQNILWWVVAAITAATWLASLGTLDYPCLTGSFEYLEGVKSLLCVRVAFDLCSLANCLAGASVQFQRQTLIYNMAMDVITDAMSKFCRL